MKLKQITFTGIGPDIDVKTLLKIQKEYPIVEWGVLLSQNWQENGKRFFDPYELYRLKYQGLNLSCHLCGHIAKRALNNDWGPAFEICKSSFAMFQRCQLNIAGYKDNPAKLDIRIPDTLNEVIIQQKSATEIDLWCSGLPNHQLSVLLDASGGRGIDTPVRVLNTSLKVGYAGGINADNVAEKLTFLMENEQVGDFWIDMESGVRTDDWFDIDKVRRVLEICEPIINKYI